ncbi:MAG: phage tail protein [Spirochaetaceae bacterium]|nr:phage tail protein [Spirochaetaceae bacterium]
MEVISVINLKNICVGLDVYKAKNRITRLFPSMENRIDIEFVEAECRRFVVLDCEYNDDKEIIKLKVASKNPIRHLPSIYQENDFLRNYLMIFQHIMNETSITLDNIDNLFRPMEVDSRFLPLISSWIGVNHELLGTEDIARKVLQYAVPLYRYRGTKLGMRALLFLVTGVVPEIIEGDLPFEAMSITEQTDISSVILESDRKDSIFSVYFPVYTEEFSSDLRKRIYRIVQNEKPINTRGYIYFKKKKEATRKVTVISEDMQIMGEEGFTI